MSVFFYCCVLVIIIFIYIFIWLAYICIHRSYVNNYTESMIFNLISECRAFENKAGVIKYADLTQKRNI